MTYSGAESGRGATYAWQGNKNIGEGCMEIIESTPNSRLAIKIDFLKPFEAHNTVEFSAGAPGRYHEGHARHVRPDSLHLKGHGTVLQHGKMVGPKFEEGLASVKAIAEK